MIFANMPDISKWQRRFLTVLFTTIFAIRGRVTFTNLARYSPLHEHTFRRHFRSFFDWTAFNLATFSLALADNAAAHDELPIAAIDCTFIPKSGKQTYGLDRFWSSASGKSERGLELSVLALIQPESGRAFTLDAAQTPPALAAGERAGGGSYSRIDFYMEQVTDCLEPLKGVRYLIADGNYAKRKVLSGLSHHGKHLITRLRSDADLRYLYTGPRKAGPGAPKKYDGKVRFGDLSRFERTGSLTDKPHIEIYTQRLNSPYFKRDFRVVVLLNTASGSYVVLCSTDYDQDAREVVRFYRLRFQIEFLFRDAKQLAGLCHCQARSPEKLDFHFNASLAAVNLARLEILLYHEGVSLVSYVRRCYNRWLVAQLLSRLGLRGRFGLNHPQVQQVVRLGSIAA